MSKLTEKVEGSDSWIYHGQVYIPNTYYAGEMGSRFLVEIRDNKRIMGTRCPKCNMVYVPARSICVECIDKLSEWVEVSNKGTLVTFCIDHEPSVVQPVKPPIIYGTVHLDGADTGFVHMLGEVDPKQLKIGMEVEAVFKDEREGSILDIHDLKPL